MPDGLHNDLPADRLPRILEAVVVTDGINDAGDALFVVAPSYSETHEFGPCGWSPRPGPEYPSRGDRALLILSEDEEQPWIPVWSPYA
jgi:hypothetical protein